MILSGYSYATQIVVIGWLKYRSTVIVGVGEWESVGMWSTHTCWNRLMLSRMLNCCQRLEKFTFPLIRSGFPRWTKVKSCRINPLREREKKLIYITYMWTTAIDYVCNLVLDHHIRSNKTSTKHFYSLDSNLTHFCANISISFPSLKFKTSL